MKKLSRIAALVVSLALLPAAAIAAPPVAGSIRSASVIEVDAPASGVNRLDQLTVTGMASYTTQAYVKSLTAYFKLIPTTGSSPDGTTLINATDGRQWQIIASGGGGGGGAPTGPAGGSLAGTYPNPGLVATGVAAGAYGDGQHVGTYTVGADGRLTVAGSSTIAPPFSAVTGSLACGQEPAMSGGDITSSAGSCVLNVGSRRITLAMMATSTAGSILAYDSSGNPVVITPGTTGQALLSNGAGALPSYQTLSGGGNALTTNPLSQFASTTSAQLATVLSDETGTVRVVYSTNPVFDSWNAYTEIAAPSSPSAGTGREWYDSTDHRLHDKNNSGVIGTTVVASTAGANQFCSSVSAAGVVGYAQPSFSNLSGSGTCAQEPALTGVVTSSAGSCTTSFASSTGSGAVVQATSPTITTATMAAATMTGRLNLGDNPIDCGSGYHSDGNKTGASPSLADFSNTCNSHTWTLTGNVTGTPTWTIGGAKHFEVWVCQDATGSRTQTWPSSPTLIWAGTGSAPTLTTTASACDVIDFSYNGTTIVGQAVASGSSGGITALTGDVTASGTGSVTTTLANIPTTATMAGKLAVTQAAAPSTPGSGTVIWADSTDSRFHDKNAAGQTGTTVVASSAGVNQFCTGITVGGGVTFAQPAFSNLSGSGTCAQEPAMTGDATSSAGSCALTIASNAVTNAKMATMAANTVKMNNTGSTATPTDVAVGTAYDAMCTRGADIASAATTSIGGQVGYDVNVTGTTTITSYGNCVAGIHRLVHFKGALTLTHNGTSLILKTGKNRITANGDIELVTCDSTNNWREDFFVYADDDVDEIDNGNVGGAAPAVADWTKGPAQKITWTSAGSGTATMTAPRKAWQRVQLTSCQNGTGGFAVVFPTANVLWPNGTAPTWTTAANKCDVATCTWNGTNYKCAATLNF